MKNLTGHWQEMIPLEQRSEGVGPPTDDEVDPNTVTDNYGTQQIWRRQVQTMISHEIDTSQFYPDLGVELDEETAWKYILQGYNPYAWQMDKSPRQIRPRSGSQKAD